MILCFQIPYTETSSARSHRHGGGRFPVKRAGSLPLQRPAQKKSDPRGLGLTRPGSPSLRCAGGQRILYPSYLISAGLSWPETACSSQIRPHATPIERAHHPEVAGSNPAPATKEKRNYSGDVVSAEPAAVSGEQA